MGLFKGRSRKSKGGSAAPSTQSSATSPDARASQEMRQQHDNRSTSNLSTTSTLQDPPTPKTRPQPPTRLTSYEAFVQRAQDAERERLEKEDRIARAWMKAAERRSNAWPVDPWRGGFGPPARDASRNDVYGMGPSRTVEENQGVRAWLGQNGLTRH